jgi:hypothetical protein
MEGEEFEKLESFEFGDHGGDVTNISESRKSYRYSKTTSWALGF